MIHPDIEVVIRTLSTYDEFTECVALQQHVWGESFADCVPASLLMVNQKIGGLAAGAYDVDGNLLGFVFGLTGVKDRRLVHWSHMLGTREEVRDLGFGRRLKLYQRDKLLDRGVEVIYWTYDPLVARNAHLNLNRLGAEIIEYVPDMYGVGTGSKLHHALGMDRFIVTWQIAKESVIQIISGQAQVDIESYATTPVVNSQTSKDGTTVIPLECELSMLPKIRVEIPQDIQIVKTESLEITAQWRATTRRAFMWYFERGYKVKVFYRDHQMDRCFYVLEK